LQGYISARVPDGSGWGYIHNDPQVRNCQVLLGIFRSACINGQMQAAAVILAVINHLLPSLQNAYLELGTCNNLFHFYKLSNDFTLSVTLSQ